MKFVMIAFDLVSTGFFYIETDEINVDKTERILSICYVKYKS